MLPPVIFPLVTWLALLLRYPGRTLAVALPLFLGIASIAGWVQWQERNTKQLLGQLVISLAYDIEQCPADRPLSMQLQNPTDYELRQLRWQLAAHRPGEQVNLARAEFNQPAYQLPTPLTAGQSWHGCLPLPELRSGYRANTLDFFARELRGSFQQ